MQDPSNNHGTDYYVKYAVITYYYCTYLIPSRSGNHREDHRLGKLGKVVRFGCLRVTFYSRMADGAPVLPLCRTGHASEMMRWRDGEMAKWIA